MGDDKKMRDTGLFGDIKNDRLFALFVLDQFSGEKRYFFGLQKKLLFMMTRVSLRKKREVVR